jgi:hypothetical protein
MVRGTICLAVMTAAVCGAARAEAGCWDERSAAAAKIRDLQSRLMVGTLQCRAFGHDMLESYNGFVRANRSSIQAANAAIKAQLASDGAEAAERRYDSFTTALANSYGAAATSDESCAGLSVLAGDAAAAAGDIGRLLELADRVDSRPELPGGRCPISFAATSASLD